MIKNSFLLNVAIHNTVVYTRESNPRLNYIRDERNHLYECGLQKMRTAGINGSRLSPRPDQSNDDVVCFGASERAKKRNDWLWSGKSPYFSLSFSFQINISVKFRARLLRNVCGNLVQKLVSDQSVEWIKRHVLAMDEEEKMDGIFRLSLHFPANAARVSRPWRSGM